MYKRVEAGHLLKEDNYVEKVNSCSSRLLLLGPAWSALAGFDPALAVYWPLDEGTGTVANDASGKGVNGTISAGPTWVTPGKIGTGALRFAAAGDVRGAHVAIDNRSFTIAMWVNPAIDDGSQILFSEQSSGANSVSLHLRLGGPASTDAPVNGIRMGFYNDDVDSPANVLQSNNWYHMTFWYDSTTKTPENLRQWRADRHADSRRTISWRRQALSAWAPGRAAATSRAWWMISMLYQKALSDQGDPEHHGGPVQQVPGRERQPGGWRHGRDRAMRR